jgi:hypothetical protein
VRELHLLFLSFVISVFFAIYSMSHPEETGFEAFFDPLIPELKKCGCSAADGVLG